MVTHVVVFKMKDRSAEAVQADAEVLRSMEGRVPSLAEIEVGVNEADLPNAYDIVLITRFESWEDLAAYRAHPYHVDPVLKHMHVAAAEAVVVDFEGA